MPHRLYLGDCLEVLKNLPPAQCLFADPPDNINLGYGEYDDTKSYLDYTKLLLDWLCAFTDHSPIVWFSFNSKWTAEVGSMVCDIVGASMGELEFKPCVQTFTFGQHSHYDLGNNHRPLWRLMKKGTPLYPDQIRVPSWRQENGDKRADPRGRVPGDVFDFTRVTGNSKQRRSWHPTQLNEDLVERCISMSTKEGDSVIDPFGGTGTTLRVCKRLKRPCTLIEIDKTYCGKIAEENGMKPLRSHSPAWSCRL